MPPSSSPVQRVSVDVWGGLGNRLFMVAAGLVESRKLGCPLLVSPGRQFSDISELLGGLDIPVLAGVALEAGSSTASKAGIRRRIAERIGAAVRPRIPIAFEETAGGRVSDGVVDGVRTRIMHGYFQNLRLVLQATDLGWPRKVELPGNSMISVSRRRGRLPDQFIGLHMRLGDYMQPVNQRKLGLPDPSFFRRAIDAVSGELGRKLPLVLFSDSPHQASELLAKVGIGHGAVLGPSDTGSEAEALWLLSQSSALVLSNSTFGWWGAFWGDPVRPVVCPTPWHDRVNSQALVDPTWIQIAKNP
jgi:hypothetical protein